MKKIILLAIAALVSIPLVVYSAPLTQNKLIKYNTANKTADSNISDNGSLVTISSSTTIDGILQVDDGIYSYGSGGISIGTTNQISIITAKQAYDSASLGAELLGLSGWTSTDWTGDFSAGFTHTVGNVSALSQSVTGTANGIYYQISFTVSNRTAGSVSLGFGSVSSIISVTSNGTVSKGIKATGTGALIFTPSSTFDGTISSISVKLISAAIANTTIFDTAGNSSYEVRSSLQASNNLSVGRSAGQYLTTGTANTSFGSQSGAGITSGTSNSSFGAQTLQATSAGQDNSAFGTAALSGNTLGNSNTAIGRSSLYSNTIGQLNTCSGTQACYNNTTGSYNNSVGYWSMLYSTNGNYNVSMGNESLFGSSGITGVSNNVAIGHQAGYSVTNNSQGNIFLGYQSGYNETGSNKLYIDNSNTANPLIKGDFSTNNLVISGSMSITGDFTANDYYSGDGSKGVTVTTCTGFKDGLCISGT